MSRVNVGTVAIKAIVDAEGVDTGTDKFAKEVGKLPKVATDAEAKLDRLTKSFNDVSRAAKLAKDATGQFSGSTLKSVPGGAAAANFLRNAGGRFGAGLGPDLGILAGAKQEAKDFQKAERIFDDIRKREQKLFRGVNATFGVLDPGKSTFQELAARSEERERRRVAREKVLTADSFNLLDDVPKPGQPAAFGSSDASKRSRIAFSLAEQRRKEEEKAAATTQASANQRRQEAESQAQRRSRVAGSLANQKRTEAEDQAQRRSRIAFSLAEQRRKEEEKQRAEEAERRANSPFARAQRGAGGLVSPLFSTTVGTFLGTGLSRIAGTVAGAAGQLVSTGLHTFESAALKAVQEGIKREDAEVSFGALLGSSKRGKALVGDVTDLALKTPFSSSELLDQSKLLLSYGVAAGDLTKTLGRLGDVASGAGVDLGRLSLAYGQVIAKGRLQGGEIRQFTEAGVGVRDFANAYNDQTGKRVGVNTFLGLSEQGQVSAAVVEKAFEKMTSAGGRFFGLMDDKSRTFGGRLQALRESADVFAGKVGKSFIDNTGVGNFLDRVTGKIQKFDAGGVDNFFRGADRTRASRCRATAPKGA
ncbi:tape measure protein [Limnoglobus roseus]|uniref:Tape measure protein N-terminal domain-containing protein n=1 Tax=Limnoglobus roseus TaxID=2598579 RepID=A0A5C1AKQ7_9BACT|nr:tape measure protein [Limnoglobus roseus]QEL18596.1 hypothetical protein PX52LOC_05628 [Limnoglobus roseus]